jgi:hypothetical protein
MQLSRRPPLDQFELTQLDIQAASPGMGGDPVSTVQPSNPSQSTPPQRTDRSAMAAPAARFPHRPATPAIIVSGRLAGRTSVLISMTSDVGDILASCFQILNTWRRFEDIGEQIARGRRYHDRRARRSPADHLAALHPSSKCGPGFHDLVASERVLISKSVC